MLNSLELVKGWTRASAVCWILLIVMDFDVNDPEVQQSLMLLEKALDRAWLLHCHVHWH